MRTLVEISEDMERLDMMLEERGGDLESPQVEAAVDLWFSLLQEEATEKFDNYAALITHYRLLSEARSAEADRLKAMSKADEARANWLKQKLENFFNKHGIRRRDTRRFRLLIQAHGGQLPVEIDVPPEKLPIRFQRVSIEPNKTMLREALERGEEIEGVRLGERGESLRIK